MISIYARLRRTSVMRRLSAPREFVEYWRWLESGRPVPPPHIVKRMAVKEYAHRHGCGVFVETGTFLGDMVEGVRGHFREIVSIEVGVELAEYCRRRFCSSPEVKIVQGDSGEVLAGVVLGLTQPAIFWLDGHYSGGITSRGSEDVPILRELNAIFVNRESRDVVLIDDARCFGSLPGYPSVGALRDWLAKSAPNHDVCVRHDIIRVTPQSK